MSTGSKRPSKPLRAATSVLLSGLLVAGSLAAAVPAAAQEAAPAAVPAAAAASSNRQQIIDTFNAINTFRAGKGLQPLRISANASSVAQDWSGHLAASGEFKHSSSFANDPRIDAGWRSASENIALEWNRTGRSIVDLWINSPGHNDNMSRPADNVIGIGMAFSSSGAMLGTTTFYQYDRFPAKTYTTAEAFLADQAPAPAFTDVPNNNAFAKEIRWMAEQGISTGWSDGTFRPYDSVRRDAMAAFMFRLAKPAGYYPPRTSPFTDVNPSAMYYKEMGWVAEQGVSTGWSDGTFRPHAEVSREAMAAFLYRLAGAPDYVPPRTSPFADVNPSHLFYKEISWLAEQGISTGWAEANGTRTFGPNQAVKRDAMAAFMYRFDQLGFNLAG